MVQLERPRVLQPMVSVSFGVHFKVDLGIHFVGGFGIDLGVDFGIHFGDHFWYPFRDPFWGSTFGAPGQEAENDHLDQISSKWLKFG